MQKAGSIDWDYVLSKENLDDAVDVFHSVITDAIQENISCLTTLPNKYSRGTL